MIVQITNTFKIQDSIKIIDNKNKNKTYSRKKNYIWMKRIHNNN